MNPGEVWRVRLPTPTGHVQGGDRPAIILQAPSATAQLPTVLVVPLTSRLGAARFPGCVLIKPDPANGLSVPSLALVFQLRALDRRDLVARLGILEPEITDRIKDEAENLLEMGSRRNPK